MVPIRGEWTPFADDQEKLEFFRRWGIIAPKAKNLRPVMVIDGYMGTPQPCEVVGFQRPTCAVIELSDGYHAIHGEYLAEMQPDAGQKLPRNTCFTEILSRYIVIDIETTGLHIGSDRIIEIAAVKYAYGIEQTVYHTLVNPLCNIPAASTRVHGITNADLIAAPTIEQVAPDFLEFIGDAPLIGHNASTFDIPFIAAALDTDITNPVIDTIPLAKKAFPQLTKYSQDYLNNVLSLSDQTLHRALNDARCTNALLWACLAPRKYESTVNREFLRNKLSGSKNSIAKQQAEKSRKSSSTSKYEDVDIKSIVPTCTDFNPNHPMYKKIIVFTGTLSIPRAEAMQLAVDRGAILRAAVSGKTNFLVVGAQSTDLVGENGVSGKEAAAMRINQTGKGSVVILNEQSFMDLVHCNPKPETDGQMTLFSADTPTEQWVFDILRPTLEDIVIRNNADTAKLVIKEGAAYSSVWYDKQMAFRVCCRDGKHYFGVSTIYSAAETPVLHDRHTLSDRSDGFTNYWYNATLDDVMIFSEFLASVLDQAIDAIPKEFDCCSRYEACSDAKCCIHPNHDFAITCGYRKIMKQGKIYYGKNKNA